MRKQFPGSSTERRRLNTNRSLICHCVPHSQTCDMDPPLTSLLRSQMNPELFYIRTELHRDDAPAINVAGPGRRRDN